MTATGVVRSLESLRDLDYRSWQVVAYREGSPGGALRLRIVGYPGRVRLDHPTPLLVSSGRFLWELADVTLESEKLSGDGRDAAAEFDLKPLLADLSQNRPLRLELPGVFTELPVPPYVVAEWRSLPEWREARIPGGTGIADETGSMNDPWRRVVDCAEHWRPWMERALALAALARGRTSPNPMVGAVVLDAAGQLLGEGYHERAGQPHAEVGALAQAGDRARGGTLVVTLEPCCHHGRTPPCCDAVLSAGITRVVVAMTDPDPRVGGQGLARLRQAGIEVVEGVAQERAMELNRAFLHRVTHGPAAGDSEVGHEPGRAHSPAQWPEPVDQRHPWRATGCISSGPAATP